MKDPVMAVLGVPLPNNDPLCTRPRLLTQDKQANHVHLDVKINVFWGAFPYRYNIM